MVNYGKAIKDWYKNFFSDENLVFLLFITMLASLVIGFLIKSYFVINGGSIFIVCGVSIAGVISYLAIESSREVREKEIEREDIKYFTSVFFEMSIISLAFQIGAKKTLIYIKEKIKIDRKKNEIMKLAQSEITEEFVKEGLKDIWNGLEEEYSVITSTLGDKIDDLQGRHNKVAECGNHLSLLHTSLMYSHKLEGVDLSRMKNFLVNYDKNFSHFSHVLFSDINSYVKDNSGSVTIKKFEDYGFPAIQEGYADLIILLKSPGMCVYKESNRYKVIKNRGLSIAMFFVVIGIINGFQFQ